MGDGISQLLAFMTFYGNLFFLKTMAYATAADEAMPN
jgi:hypothetical protein